MIATKPREALQQADDMEWAEETEVALACGE